MARKKKNNNNQTTSAAPKKEQAQKQSQEESRVIDELFGNIAANTVIRGCGSRQHRNPGRQRLNERTNTAVVGAEIVTPVRNTVRLINDE